MGVEAAHPTSQTHIPTTDMGGECREDMMVGRDILKVGWAGVGAGVPWEVGIPPVLSMGAATRGWLPHPG